MWVFYAPLQIDDVIDEIISLESSYDEMLSFGPAEGGLQLPNTVRRPFKGFGGRGGGRARVGAWLRRAPPIGAVGGVASTPYKALCFWEGLAAL